MQYGVERDIMFVQLTTVIKKIHKANELLLQVAKESLC
jgi:hypothetical protein